MTEFASKKLFASPQQAEVPIQSIGNTESYSSAAVRCFVQLNEIRLDFETYARSSKTKTVWIVCMIGIVIFFVALLTFILIKRIRRLGHKQ
jgi:hypothetical protein